MSTETPKTPDGIEMYSPETPAEIPTVNPESGETIYGVVLDLEKGEHEDGRPWYKIRIKDEDRGVVNYFAHDQCLRACNEGRVEVGELLYVRRDVEEASFVDDAGEEVTYVPTLVGFPEADD